MKIKENAQFETISKLRPKYKKFVLSEDVLMTCRSIKVDDIYENMINDYPSGYGKHMCSILKLLPNRECILYFPSNKNSLYNNIVFEYVKTDEGVVFTLNQLVGNTNTLVRTTQYFSFKDNTTNVNFQTNGINGIDEKLKLQLDEFYLNLFGNNYYTNTITDMIEFILKPMIFIELSGKNVKFIDIKSKNEYGNIFKPLHIKNQTKVDVVYVNSLWNVGSIGLGEFKVRGHFRLQPCGTGRGQIKLIFIEEFVKTHYIRRSTKELVLG
jgi:hypothetical protein